VAGGTVGTGYERVGGDVGEGEEGAGVGVCGCDGEVMSRNTVED